MSDSPSAPSPPAAAFNYNVRWMSTTFSSRAKVEALLGPEQAAGNISTHDYDAAMNFLPGLHRYYGILCSTAVLSAIYVLRRPSWSQRRIIALTVGGSFGSLAFGNALTLKSHFDFVRSLNNPGGFAKATERIQQQSGLPLPQGPILQRRFDPEEELHGNVEDRQAAVVEPTSQTHEPPPQSQASENTEARPSSKWDQIRAANSAATTTSSWDALRQKHEKPRQSFATDTSDDNRAAEQAQFDALLEKERNFGSQAQDRRE